MESKKSRKKFPVAGASTTESRTIHAYKVPAGHYFLSPNFAISLDKKPHWLTRKLTKLLLQWEWRDA